MRRISALALVGLLVLVGGCSGADSGGSAEPTQPAPSVLSGAWTDELSQTAVKTAQQIIAFRDQGQPVPKDLKGFFLFLADGQSYSDYTTDGTDFSFCVSSSDGWVAFDSSYGGTVNFGDSGSCDTDPSDAVLAVRQAAVELAAVVDTAIQNNTGDLMQTERDTIDGADLPPGLSVGSSEVSYGRVEFCVQDEYDTWAAYSPKASTSDHVAVGIMGGC